MHRKKQLVKLTNTYVFEDTKYKLVWLIISLDR